MAEAAQERVQTSMTSMVDDIDKSYLRKMQVCIHPVLRTVAMVAVVLWDGANAGVHRCRQTYGGLLPAGRHASLCGTVLR